MNDQPHASALRRAFLKIEELEAQMEAVGAAAREPLALVGCGCRLPGHIDSPDALWRLLAEGGDATGDIPPDRWDIEAYFDPEPGVPGKMYTRRGGFLREVDRFDAAFFGISAREAAHLDPQQRLLLEVAWEALEQAGIAPLSLRGSQTGVYIGQATYDYAHLQVKSPDPTVFDAYFGTGTAASVASGRLSYVLGLHGPALTIDTACSSSLVALHLACQALQRKDCDLALVGGVNLILSPEAVVSMCQSRMMAPDGRCKTFDADADGFGQAEGCVVFVVKRLADAKRDGDVVLAMVRGSAVNQDGASSGLTAPSGPAQEAVIRAALKDAGLSAHDVAYVEAHGTGTALGDPIEVNALSAVFSPGRSTDQPLWIGSIKTNLGHLEAAAGLAGLLKVVLSLQHQQIPAHLHFNKPSPLIPWDEVAMRVVDGQRPYPPIAGRRMAGLSSFGFSGTNVHVVLEESQPQPVPVEHAGRQLPRLMTLSARSGGALREMVEAYRELLSRSESTDWPHLARSANTGRSSYEHRIALIAESADEANKHLGCFLAGQRTDGLQSTVLESVDPPRIAFLFGGQGVQYLGMGRELYERQSEFRKAFDECDALFSPYLNGSIAHLLYHAADAKAASDTLDETQWAQPALFAVEWALAALWRARGIEPGLVIGHGFGEYVAACVSGVFSLADAVRLVAARATLMARLPKGAMITATTADTSDMIGSLAQLPGVSVAAVNSPTSLVISGPHDAVESAERQLSTSGVDTSRLAVSSAFHSAMLDPLLDELEAIANSIEMAEPRTTFVSNLTGRAAKRGEVSTGRYWRDHARRTVQFADGLLCAQKLGYRLFIEMSPNPILAAFVTQTLGDQCLCLPTLRPDHDPRRTGLETLSRLYLKGATIDWKGFEGTSTRGRFPLPTYPFQRSRFWFEPAPQANLSRRPVPEQARPSFHPHLTRRTDTALGDILFETRLDDVQHPYLADHVVHGRAILPTAFYLDLIASAVGEVLAKPGAVLRDVIIHQAIAIPSEGKEIQLLLSPAADIGRVQIFSREEQGQWTLAVSGNFETNECVLRRDNCPTIPPENIQAESVEIDRFYTALQRIGLAFGPTFRRLSKLQRRDGEATGEINPFPIGQDRFGCHPAVLDACLQTLAAALPGFDPETFETDVYMPIGIDSFEIVSPPAGRLKSRAWFAPLLEQRPKAREILTGHVLIEDPSGRCVARISGVQMKRVDTSSSRSNALDQLTYAVAWHEIALEGSQAQPPIFADLNWREHGRSLHGRFQALKGSHGLTDQALLEPALDALCSAYIVTALIDLGWHFKVGQRLIPTGLANPMAPERKRLLGRLLAILEEDGLLQRLGGRLPDAFDEPSATDAWMVVKDVAKPHPGPTASDLIKRFPRFRAEILFAERGGLRLAEALRGTVDATEVLFPDGSSALLDTLYRQSPAALVFNAIAGEALSEAVRQAPTDRRLRVLEIGGGTGGVTSAILPVLPADRTIYTFTDLSPAFAKKAAEQFADFTFLRFEALDIEKPPADQGFELQAYDLIIASNVLHATANLSRALDHVRSLLVVGGQLLVLEGLKPSRWIDLSFGLTAGWWKFSDSLRRDYPLVPPSVWRRVLIEKGFSDPTFTPAEESEGNESQALILTSLRRTAVPLSTRANADRQFLIFADGQGVAESLSTTLFGEGSTCVLVRPSDRFREGPSSDFGILPEAPADYRALFRALQSRGAMPGTIVFLWPIDSQLEDNATADQLDTQLRHTCGSLLSLLRAHSEAAGGAPVTVWIVTQSAQSVVNGDPLNGLPQSALLGMAKVVALELPEVACRRFDIQDRSDVGALADEIRGSGDEPVVAVRNGNRYIPRLVPFNPSSTHPRQEARQLEIVTRGSPDGLALRPLVRRALKNQDVEIDVLAAGLNFRDVLNVLGARDDTVPLGGEVSGLVTGLGAGVEGLAIGQPVVAITVGELGEVAVASAELVLPKPQGLNFQQAAGSPLAFLTAHYALTAIGEMRANERVLIHAAAGGVGMAAVQLAQKAGLEVLATAGSEAKRDALRSLGVRHVFDSRSIDFATALQGDGVDLVLSAMTGPAAAASLALLRPGGRFLEIGKVDLLSTAEAKAVNPHAVYHVVDLADLIVSDPAAVRPMFVDVMAKLESGALQPLPTRSFSLDDASSAFKLMARAKHIGKVVLTMHQPAQAVDRTSDTKLRLKPDATYLVSGGLNGLGLVSAQRLVERGARNLVLFGRRPPSDAAQTVIETMRRAGASVIALAADVSSEEDMRRLSDEVLRAAPPVRGIIHAAGRLEDAVLTQQRWSRFVDVLAPKARGAWLLRQLCADQELDFFVFYSSASALLGAPGQSNHAAANAFLDGMAFYLQARGVPALSLNWGAWAEVGAAADRDVTERLGKRGVDAISVEEGLHALERLILSPGAQTGVIRADWGRVAASLESPAERRFLDRLTTTVALAPSKMAPDAQTKAIDLDAAPIDKRAGLLTVLIREQVSKVLGAPLHESVSDRQPFRDLGLDSLMALELRTGVRTALGLEAPLPATLAFDHPTIAALVDHLMVDVYGWTVSAPEKTMRHDLSVIDAIEQMSDEEVDRLLARREAGAE